LKKAETIADQITQTIVGQRREPGELLGSEVELIARYGVSRAVFREAVRLLEHHGLVEMRRGLHGGLFIRQPDPKPVAKAMAVYLDFEKVEPRQLEDARLAIEVVCVERVAARISEDEVAEVRAFLAAEAARVASGRVQSLHEFHVLVARLTANPALHLFVQTLTDLTQRQQQPVPDRSRRSLDEVHAAHANRRGDHRPRRRAGPAPDDDPPGGPRAGDRPPPPHGTDHLARRTFRPIEHPVTLSTSTAPRKFGGRPAQR
jgi:DNA-binding FadR family transcriptional regulator